MKLHSTLLTMKDPSSYGKKTLLDLHMLVIFMNYMASSFRSSLYISCYNCYFGQFMIQDLEDSLGEVEFKDGMPDVKFSRVRISNISSYYCSSSCYFEGILHLESPHIS